MTMTLRNTTRSCPTTYNWCNRLLFTPWKTISATYLLCVVLQTVVYDSESWIIRSLMRMPTRMALRTTSIPLVHSQLVVSAKKDDDEEGIYYNDFEEFSSSSSEEKNSNNLLDWSTLKSRITQTKDAIVERDNRLATNWRSGHWSVRGFQLDKYNPIERLLLQKEEEPTTRNTDVVISVSRIALDSERSSDDHDTTDDSSIAVGRTDGTICIVQLGNEYMTKFQAIPAVSFSNTTETSSMSQVQYSSKLVRAADRKEETNNATTTPFQILHQFQASTSSISALFMEGRDVITASAKDGDVHLWELPITPHDDELLEMKPKLIFQGAHSKNVIEIQSLVLWNVSSKTELSIVVTVSTEGSIGIWNRETGHLIRCVRIQDSYQQPIPILSANIWKDENLVLVGLDNGYVQGYAIQELLSSSKQEDIYVTPSCNFLAHGSTQKGGVTALCCIGKGTTGLFKANAKPSILLVTGGADGIVKQWEIFFSSSSDTSLLKLEHWPRIASQRMKRRAHMFEGGHGDKITALVGDASKILSAGADGRIVAWSPSTGEKMYSMDGFDDTLSNICLDKSLLITDGMSNYVCLHDFDLDQDSFEDSYELEF